MKTFRMWLFDQRSRNDPVGDLAKDAFQDPNWNDGKKSTLKKLVLSANNYKSEDAFNTASQEYRWYSKCTRQVIA